MLKTKGCVFWPFFFFFPSGYVLFRILFTVTPPHTYLSHIHTLHFSSSFRHLAIDRTKHHHHHLHAVFFYHPLILFFTLQARRLFLFLPSTSLTILLAGLIIFFLHSASHIRTSLCGYTKVPKKEKRIPNFVTLYIILVTKKKNPLLASTCDRD